MAGKGILTFFTAIPLIFYSTNAVGQNKNIPQKYESLISIAFEKYPDLKENKIFFKEKRLHKFTMTARPKINFIFLPREKHQYQISINNKDKKDLILDSFSCEEQTGIMGHELAHIIDYKQKNDLQLITTGAKYLLSKKYRKKLENKVDKIAINHGFGDNLYKSRLKSFEMMSKNPDYWKKEKEIYYSPEEILKLINE